jgi:hypothetical protein
MSESFVSLRIRGDMRCSTIFVGEYFDRNTQKYVRIMENGDVIRLTRQNLDLSDSSGVLYLPFTPNKPDHPIPFDLSDFQKDKTIKYPFQYALKAGESGRRFREFIKALINHPDVECNYPKSQAISELIDHGVNKRSNPMFQLVVPDMDKHISALSIRDRINMEGQIASMSGEERRELCYFFGFSPLNMDDDAVFNSLLDPEKGAIKDAYNASRFKEEYCRFGEADMDSFKMLMVIKKAMVYARLGYGPLQDKGSEGFWRGSEFIGRDETAIVAYMSEHKSVYNSYVLPSVEEVESSSKYHDQEPSDDSVSALVTQERSAPRKAVKRTGKTGRAIHAASVDHATEEAENTDDDAFDA